MSHFQYFLLKCSKIIHFLHLLNNFPKKWVQAQEDLTGEKSFKIAFKYLLIDAFICISTLICKWSYFWAEHLLGPFMVLAELLCCSAGARFVILNAEALAGFHPGA